MAEEKKTWEQTDFLWHFALAQRCDIMPAKDPELYFKTYCHDIVPFDPKEYAAIKEGDAVWVQGRHVARFCNEVLPNVKNHFVLVITQDDEAFPSDMASKMNVEAFIADKRIIAIFAQNCDYKGKNPKVHPFPIGIDFHTIAYKPIQGTYWSFWAAHALNPLKQESFLKQLRKMLPPTPARLKRAFVDFHHNDSMRKRQELGQYSENRAQIFEQLVKTNLIDYGEKISRDDLWRVKGQYAFSISPHGHGLDCHRTWEDLALGCIVIVKTSALDPLYKDLPVVIVKEWSEVTKENLEKWLTQYGDVLNNPKVAEILTNDYWWKQIAAATAPFKRKHRR